MARKAITRGRGSPGLAVVIVKDIAHGKKGLIDKKGKMVIEPRFDYAGRNNREKQTEE